MSEMVYFPCVAKRQGLSMWVLNGELVVDVEHESDPIAFAQDQVDALIVYLVSIRGEVDDQTKGLAEACATADIIAERDALRAELAALKDGGAA